MREPRSWADALAWVDGADFSAQDLQIPDWIVQVGSDGVFAGPGADASAIVMLPAGTVGVMCATGEWPEFTTVDGGSMTLRS